MNPLVLIGGGIAALFLLSKKKEPGPSPIATAMANSKALRLQAQAMESAGQLQMAAVLKSQAASIENTIAKATGDAAAKFVAKIPGM